LASAFAYIYNLTDQYVALEGDVTFDTNGDFVGGITHTLGDSAIVVASDGEYEIDFGISSGMANQFTVFVNGTAVSGSTYGAFKGTRQNNGIIIVGLASGDVITLRNHSSPAGVTLQTLAGGSEVNVNASIVIKRLGDSPK
jgi:hypothetical protein